MSYRRFRAPNDAPTPATVATVATERVDPSKSVASVASVAAPDVVFDERAAIVEFDANVPREWAEGFAKLDLAKPLTGFTKERWRQMIDDGGRFLDRWSSAAASSGWTAADVFGLHPAAPAARIEGMGLVPLIRGGEVIAIEQAYATIRMPSGNCLTYYLRRPRPDSLAVWELEDSRATSANRP